MLSRISLSKYIISRRGIEILKKMDNLEEIDNFISQLIGESVSSSDGSLLAPESNIRYQLPLRHTKGGNEINETNKPWIVGTFIPNQYINETHPQGHEGVDLKAPRNSPIYPIGPGTVIEARSYNKGGNTCKISHEDGRVISYYAHMDKCNVSPGTEVNMNTVIGTVGDSGNAKERGAHLHYEVKVDGKKIDPQTIVGKVVGSISKKADIVYAAIKCAK